MFSTDLGNFSAMSEWCLKSQNFRVFARYFVGLPPTVLKRGDDMDSPMNNCVIVLLLIKATSTKTYFNCTEETKRNPFLVSVFTAPNATPEDRFPLSKVSTKDMSKDEKKLRKSLVC